MIEPPQLVHKTCQSGVSAPRADKPCVQVSDYLSIFLIATWRSPLQSFDLIQSYMEKSNNG